MMNLNNFDRRRFLMHSATGLGAFGLSSLLASEQPVAGANTLPHFAGKAKSVIFLFMSGAPSQLDLFDPKPAMKKYDGQSLPESMTKDLQLAFIKPSAHVWASPRKFAKCGESGMEFSDYLPHIATCADDICMIRSMYTEQFNHNPGEIMLSCGTPLVGRPSMGSWVVYGLGSQSRDLPGYIVLSSGGVSFANSLNWSSGFLPSSYQGVPFRNSGNPVLYLSNPTGVNQAAQRSTLDAIRDLNHEHFLATPDPEILSRIESYELAFRMQTAAPDLLDFSQESPATLAMYGVNEEPTRAFGSNCLLARRMVERGVRFVELIHGSWDDHSELTKNLKSHCEMTDQPAAALLKDLKQRGLLDSTLVVWGGEFGRTPMVQAGTPGNAAGRDHHPFGYTVWMAGGGVKGGQVIGETDDLGLNVVKDKVHVHDLHATMLHCLGLEHAKLTYRHQGRDFRLTDVAGQVVAKALA